LLPLDGAATSFTRDAYVRIEEQLRKERQLVAGKFILYKMLGRGV